MYQERVQRRKKMELRDSTVGSEDRFGEGGNELCSFPVAEK